MVLALRNIAVNLYDCLVALGHIALILVVWAFGGLVVIAGLAVIAALLAYWVYGLLVGG